MCGRFVRTSPADVIRHEFGVTSVAAVDLAPRFNVCPGEPVAAIVQHGQHGEDRRLGLLRWGLAPRGQINVRSESASRQALSRDAFRRRRCAIVADAFYEWANEGDEKRPFLFRLSSHRPFVMAGIWSRDPDSSAPATAILTKDADAVVGEIHSRMPVILPRSALDRWLDDSVEDPAVLEALLHIPNEPLESYRVSTLVNSGRNDSPDCIRPEADVAERTLRLVPRRD